MTAFKSEFSSSFEKLKNFFLILLDWIKFKKTNKSVTEEEVNESIMSIKNTIIDALKEENLKLQNKV